MILVTIRRAFVFIAVFNTPFVVVTVTFFVFYSQEADMQSLEKHVNFENENSRKAYYREFKKVGLRLGPFKPRCRTEIWRHFFCADAHGHII